MCGLVESNELKVYQFIKHSGDIHCLFKGKLVENKLNFIHYRMKHELNISSCKVNIHKKRLPLFTRRGLC